MKLLHRITFHISIALLIFFVAWGTLFYYIIVDEINDETDDSLEHYSEYIIARALRGEKLPENENGTNNSYHIRKVTAEYAASVPAVEFSDEMIYMESKQETEPARIYKTVFKNKEGEYSELTVIFPTFEKDDLKKTILFWILLLYFIQLVIIVAVNAFIQHHSLKPLYIMLEWIDNLKLAKHFPPLNIRSEITEFHKLSDALLRSARRNSEMYEQQSLFIGHASHELQTPIAIAQNRLEILADDPGLSETQLSQILKTRQSLENLSKLNKTLLLLTKIENRQFPNNRKINVNTLAASLLEDFHEAYGRFHISCVLEEKTEMNIHIDESLAVVLFSNIIKNAFVHNRSDGIVRICISGRRICFSNTSSKKSLNPDYIFQRFYRETEHEGSTGLGLSLVDSICKLYSIEISYTYKNETHNFELKIPQDLITGDFAK